MLGWDLLDFEFSHHLDNIKVKTLEYKFIQGRECVSSSNQYLPQCLAHTTLMLVEFNGIAYVYLGLVCFSFL
jgi:hypothetical protein